MPNMPIYDMVFSFDLSRQAQCALDELMKTGQFQNISEAASMAFVNYQVIHQSVAKSEQRATASQHLHTEVAISGASNLEQQNAQIPELFGFASAPLDGLSLQEIPDVPAAHLPPARWFFGQFNKFLPAKVTCRGLLNMLRENPNGVPLAKATETISTEAWVLGDHLYLLDQRSNRSREDAFAAAFPLTAGNGARSRTRFANQFVGDLRQPKKSEDRLHEVKFNGLPSALKFIVCTGGKNPS